MAGHRKTRKGKQTTTILVVRVFAIILLCLGLFVAFRYYRRQALQQEQIRQAELAKQEAAAKLLRQKKAFIQKVGPISQKVDKGTGLSPRPAWKATTGKAPCPRSTTISSGSRGPTLTLQP